MTAPNVVNLDSVFVSTDDIGSYSSDPSRPDYACSAYQRMAPYWQIVHDVAGSTIELRKKRAQYLPRFEAETIPDWNARISLTFAQDDYNDILEEQVGLVFAQKLTLGDDVPSDVKECTEDFDGEGNHIEVFAQNALHTAMHWGHAILFTDFPRGKDFQNRTEEKNAGLRPYCTAYPATDILAWKTAVVGGSVVLTRVTFRERYEEDDREFGSKTVERYREIKQQVNYDDVTGRAISLGQITWRAWKKRKTSSASQNERGAGMADFEDAGSGTIVGPTRIPARIVYGGKKTGYLQSEPALYGISLNVIEQTQVQSDYATTMHKCNVPTPIFVGRQQAPLGGDKVAMGHGIDINIGGNAFYMEPAGTALAATRTRIEDIRLQIQKRGAHSDSGSLRQMSATEAALAANQRNAKVRRGARSLQDALEGVLSDMNAFLVFQKKGVAGSIGEAESSEIQKVKAGGSVKVNADFAGNTIDSNYLRVLVDAYKEHAIPLEALMYALEHGKLPDDFSSEEAALRLIAESMNRPTLEEQEAALAEKRTAALAATGGKQPPDKSPQKNPDDAPEILPSTGSKAA